MIRLFAVISFLFCLWIRGFEGKYIGVQVNQNGTWWFVQNGKPFLSIGVRSITFLSQSQVNHVNDGGADDGVGGRESSQCRQRTGNPLCGDTLSFGRELKFAPYHNVTQILYNPGVCGDSMGPNYEWAEATLNRIQSWGMNTISGWSNRAVEQEVGKTTDMYYAHLLDIGTTWLNSEGLDHDVFTQAFVDQCYSIASKEVLLRCNDTQLIGYQLDNEIRLFAPNGLCFDYYLTYPATSPGNAKAVSFLVSKYASNINLLNSAWNITASSFSDIRNHIRDQGLNRSAFIDDSNEFLPFVALRYFSVAQAAIRTYDTNHLILGVRGIYLPPNILQLVAKYFDVFDFHCYDDLPDIALYDQVHSLTGKPLIVGEFSFTAMDSNMNNTIGARGGVPYTTQAERANGFKRFVLRLIERPYVVGYHWWQYADEPTSGRWPDGENSNYGLVSLTDNPYSLLTEAMTDLNNRAEKIHGAIAYPSLLLSQYWAQSSRDSYLDTICRNCAPDDVSPINGPYIFRSSEGLVSPVISGDFSLPLNLCYNNQTNKRMTNVKCNFGYNFVQTIGYGLPLSSGKSGRQIDKSWKTCNLGLFYNNVNEDFLTTCQEEKAKARNYTFMNFISRLVTF